MKLSRTSIALILLILTGIFGSLALQYGLFMVHYDTIKMDIKIADRVGFNTATDALHFGTTYRGSESRRDLVISNKFNFPVIVSISNSGNMSEWVTLSMETFHLDALQNETVYYVASPPVDATPGICR